MLKKAERLNLKHSFRYVAAGKKAETANMKLFFRFNSSPIPLVGVASSGKVFKTAVTRNQAKRKVMTVIEGYYPRLKLGLNLVIMPKGELLNTDSGTLDREFSEFCIKEQLLK